MPTMNVSLTAELVEFVEGDVSNGDYVSASEVVRDAIRMMRRDRNHDEAKLLTLRNAIEEGIGAADRGAFSERSVAEILKPVFIERRR